jgi:hypothetical protein
LNKYPLQRLPGQSSRQACPARRGGGLAENMLKPAFAVVLNLTTTMASKTVFLCLPWADCGKLALRRRLNKLPQLAPKRHTEARLMVAEGQWAWRSDFRYALHLLPPVCKIKVKKRGIKRVLHMASVAKWCYFHSVKKSNTFLNQKFTLCR